MVEANTAIEGETPEAQRGRKSRLSISKRIINQAKTTNSPSCPPPAEKRKKRPPEEVNSNDFNGDAFYGLPQKAKQMFQELRGISEVYEWQDECLRCSALREGRNLLVSLPTSGGKTLVAEILMLQQLSRKRDVLMILPFVSIVQEKIKGLIPFGLEFDFLVEEYAGSRGRIPPIRRRKKSSLYVATIEKAQTLLNSLIETKRIDRLALVIVDELHMIGESGRGPVLEQTLTKLKLSGGRSQIVGMSATLGNIAHLQSFLSAELFSGNFRPVQLKEFFKIGESLFSLNLSSDIPEEALEFQSLIGPSSISSDPDNLLGLISPIVPSGSCLVFCPTKKNAENVALLLAQLLPKGLKQHEVKKKKELLRGLMEDCENRCCNVLKRCIPYGVAYHHSGLTGEERRLLQEAYLDGALCVLCATSTLAAGVNLPAQRVILRSPNVGCELMSRQQYKQMSGRAGRAGLDTKGDSVVILSPKNQSQFLRRLLEPVEECRSRLTEDGGRNIRAFFLGLVSLQLIKCKSDGGRILRESLLGAESGELNVEVDPLAEEALSALETAGLVMERDGRLSVTELGSAAAKGPIDVELVTRLLEDLRRPLREGLVLATHLHLLHCVVPYDHQFQDIRPNWNLFYEQFSGMNREERRVLELQGITEGVLVRMMTRVTTTKVDESLSRAYLALVLYNLWKKERLWDVASKFELPRGRLQSFLQSSAAFASCVSRFCQSLPELWPYQSLLPDFVRQLSHCVQMELIPLMEIQGVKQARARQLYAAGYRTVGAVAEADADALMLKIEHLSRKQARQIVASARMLRHEELAAHMDQIEQLLVPSEAGGTNTDKLLETIIKTLV